MVLPQLREDLIDLLLGLERVRLLLLLVDLLDSVLHVVLLQKELTVGTLRCVPLKHVIEEVIVSRTVARLRQGVALQDLELHVLNVADRRATLVVGLGLLSLLRVLFRSLSIIVLVHDRIKLVALGLGPILVLLRRTQADQQVLHALHSDSLSARGQ